MSGGTTEILFHERASASPWASPRTSAPGAPKSRGTERPPSSPPTTADSPRALREAQEWFASAVMGPDGALDEGTCARVVTAGPRMSASARIGVYHHAYRARLHECLEDDYPVLKHALGGAAFEALALEYVDAHPSHAPSLNAYGRHMASFCRTRATDDVPRGFAADLAALEWALVEVVHAPAAGLLSAEALQAIAPDRWGGARLPANPTVRLLSFRYPVNEYFQGVRAEGDPAVPSEAPSATAVWRQGTTIWRMDVSPVMAALLGALFAGDTLGAALEAVERAAQTPESLAEAERNVMVWFREWVASGFFARIELPETTSS